MNRVEHDARWTEYWGHEQCRQNVNMQVIGGRLYFDVYNRDIIGVDLDKVIEHLKDWGYLS